MTGLSAPQLAAAAVIALAVAVGLVRFRLRRLRTAPSERGARRRATALTILPAAAGAALYLTLFPLSVAAPVGAMAVATAGAPGLVAVAPGERLVALPEAGPVMGAEHAPDLAAALRRHPDVRTVRVVGQGLAPRDRNVSGVAVRFDPGPPPVGVVALSVPDRTSPGARFDVGGQIGSLRAGSVELVDPAGAVVDRAAVRGGERFKLAATARAAGLALFELRLKDVGGRVIERLDVPVDASAGRAPRVVVLAGAPSAEIKFLRRWAEDAGVSLAAEAEVGAGVRIGDPVPPLTAQGLADVDLAVVDDRRWASLSAGSRAALLAAAEDGMGLLLRPASALSPEVRRSWAALGLAVTDAPAASAASSDGDPADPDAALPAPTRLAVAASGPNAVALVRAADGRPVAAWTARGRGRVGVLTVPDSWVLQTTGRGDAHGRLWSDLFAALARPEPEPPVRVEGPLRAGERVALCAPTGPAVVLEPGGREVRPVADSAAGCAGWWPASAGWAVIRTAAGERAVYVHPADAAPSLQAAEATAATLALGSNRLAASDTERSAPGSPWPAFAALLVFLALLWTLERRRFDRPPATNEPATSA